MYSDRGRSLISSFTYVRTSSNNVCTHVCVYVCVYRRTLHSQRRAQNLNKEQTRVSLLTTFGSLFNVSFRFFFERARGRKAKNVFNVRGNLFFLRRRLGFLVDACYCRRGWFTFLHRTCTRWFPRLLVPRPRKFRRLLVPRRNNS